ATRIAFLAKAAAAQHRLRALVFRQGRSLQAMQLQFLKDIWDQRPHGSGDIALPREWRARPIAQCAELLHAAMHVRQGAAADQGPVALTADEEGISAILAHLALVAADAAAIGTFGQFIDRPCRLPWQEEIPALLAQRRPFGKVGKLRLAQKNALAPNQRHDLRFRYGSQKGHGERAPPNGRRAHTRHGLPSSGKSCRETL